jgi:(1->4)-alpha-D-glucan 1-alpha-D-glucosylmutase
VSSRSGPPLATYRLQLTPNFGLDDAAAVVPYLARLGVSHLYTSPHLQAAPGSTHGYDVVDHSRVNAELGGEAAYERLLQALREHDLGLVPDVVPNHMAVGVPQNRWWWDVLENGPASRYASHFDVDWDPPEIKLRNRVLVPVLGDHYGRVLESGDLQLQRDGAEFSVTYAERRFPVAPRSLDDLLGEAAASAGSDELAFLAGAYGALPPATAPDPESRHRRHRDTEILRGLLKRLLTDEPALGPVIDAAVARINGDPDLLDALLQRQNYRLAHWRTASEELDYRRFFDIATLAGLRMDAPGVFEDVHRLVLEGYRRGVVHGLRIDHPDGLPDPSGYLERLAAEAPNAWIVVEKILEPGEELPPWPVAGTTGYDFAARLDRLLVDPTGETPLTELYARFTGETASFHDVVIESKRLVLRRVLAADLNRLAEKLSRVGEEHRRYRDFTRHDLRSAIEAVGVHFPVYRTYLRPGEEPSDDDVRHIAEAVGAARDERTDLDPELFDFLAEVLLLRIGGPEAADLAIRFQQFSGPAMAKGVEDTAFYRYHRLVSLNEVGGDPGLFGLDVGAFHRASRHTAEHRPATMLTTSTHDTKRSEDVRARLHLLSEIPEQWSAAVQRWAVHNERHRHGDLPDRNLEYLVYQTLVAAHPLPLDRLQPYLEKATREAKRHTSWTDPDPVYDESVRAFAAGLLGDAEFLEELAAFVAPLVWPGRVNSLALTLLKLTSPGVPDLYQGSELWTDGLVDPDNRRPVDFARRCALLAEVEHATPEELLTRADEGLPKLAVTHRALLLRQRRPQAFLPGPDGEPRPLEVSGAETEHAVAFTRGDEVAVVAPRLPLGLAKRGGWADTVVELPAGRWRNLLSDESVAGGGPARLERMLRRFPAALLERESGA